MLFSNAAQFHFLAIDFPKQGVTDCANEIMTTEGVAGFYRGFGALIVQGPMF